MNLNENKLTEINASSDMEMETFAEVCRGYGSILCLHFHCSHRE